MNDDEGGEAHPARRPPPSAPRRGRNMACPLISTALLVKCFTGQVLYWSSALLVKSALLVRCFTGQKCFTGQVLCWSSALLVKCCAGQVLYRSTD